MSWPLYVDEEKKQVVHHMHRQTFHSNSAFNTLLACLPGLRAVFKWSLFMVSFLCRLSSFCMKTWRQQINDKVLSDSQHPNVHFVWLKTKQNLQTVDSTSMWVCPWIYGMQCKSGSILVLFITFFWAEKILYGQNKIFSQLQCFPINYLHFGSPLKSLELIGNLICFALVWQ